MVYRRAFRVRAPIERVRAFHADAAGLAAITPPPVRVTDVQAPSRLGEGDEMAFTLRVGPVPIRWRARIQDVSPSGFTDVQTAGPFRTWEHRHAFLAEGDDATEVRDTVTWRLHPRPDRLLVGLAMGATLPFLFRYREWRTRRLLEADGG